MRGLLSSGAARDVYFAKNTCLGGLYEESFSIVFFYGEYNVWRFLLSEGSHAYGMWNFAIGKITDKYVKWMVRADSKNSSGS